MSFDLFVFEPARAVTAAEAAALHAGPREGLVAGARIDAFYEALVKVYPQLDDDEEASPFAATLDRLPGAVVMPIVFSRADEVHAAVERLAAQHGLHVFDPQSGKLFAPGAVPRATPPKKLSSREGVTRFCALVTPALAELGFVPVKRKKDRWRRGGEGGRSVELALNLATRDARPDIALVDEDVLRPYLAAVGPKELAPLMGLQHLYFGGLIAGRPWDAAYEGSFAYELCHEECVDASARTFLAEVELFALPLGNVALGDFFGGGPAGTSRKNWGPSQEKVPGPAGRFWRWDRGLVYVTAAFAVARPSERAAIFADARARFAQWRAKQLHAATPTLGAELDALERALA